MVALRDQLLPEESDVLARVSPDAFDVASMTVVQSVFRAAAALRGRLERSVLADEDLTWSSFTMLFCLWTWGPLETRDLADRMGVSRPTVSGVTDTLERRRLVRRRADQPDARLRTVTLTEAGQQLFAELFPRFNAQESAICSHLDTDERESLAGLLRTVVHSARGDDPDGY